MLHRAGNRPVTPNVSQWAERASRKICEAALTSGSRAYNSPSRSADSGLKSIASPSGDYGDPEDIVDEVTERAETALAEYRSEG